MTLYAAVRREMAARLPVMKVTLRCTGTRKDGRLCDHLLARLAITAFEGKIELKCDKCHKVTIYD